MAKKSKLNLINDDLTWNADRRYKVNSVVQLNGEDYQNITGKNSNPELLIDWQKIYTDIAISDVTGLPMALDDLQLNKEDKSNKNIANGYAGLDSNGKIIPTQLPALAITDTFVVASQAEQLALVAEVGDVAVRTDLNKSFILRVTGASTLANWQELLSPTSVDQTIIDGSTNAVSGNAVFDGLALKLNSSNPTTSGVVTLGSDPLAPVGGYSVLTRNTATGIVSMLPSNTYRFLSDDVDWTEISNKPSTIAPSPHTHVISDVTGLQGELNNKLDKNNPSATGTLTLQTDPSILVGTFDILVRNPSSGVVSKIPETTYRKSSVDVPWTEVSGKPSTFLPSAHTHTVSQITDFPTFKTIENQSIVGAGNIDLNKSDVELGNVDNTSDLNKPISTATQTALNLKVSLTEKGTANGVATLGADGKVPNSQIPALAISETYPVSSQTEMLALSSAEQGDVAIRSDISKSYILRVSPSSVLSNWSELLSPTDAVTSVNGQTGVVNLNKSDVGLGNVDNTSDLSKPISTATQTALNNKADISQLHNPVTIGTANGLSLSTQQLSLGLASSGVTGALSGTDWNTFNGKFPTPTGLITNYLPKWNGSSFGNSQVFDNGTNVGIGTTTPDRLLTLRSNSSVLKLVVDAEPLDYWTELQTLYQTNSFKLINRTAGITKEFLGRYGGALSIMPNNDGNTLFGKTNDAGDGRVQVNGNITASPAVSPNQVVVKSQLDAVASGTVNLTGNQTIAGIKTFSGAIIGTTANFSGTVTVPDPTNPFNAATKNYVDQNTRPYKVYTALLSQSGTNAPTATVLENTLGGTVVWSRTNNGVYVGTLTGAFASNKTTIQITGTVFNAFFAGFRNDANTVTIGSSNTSGIGADNLILNSTIEIRVYL